MKSVINSFFFISTLVFLVVSCKNNKKEDFSIIQSSENIDYSSPEYMKYQFDKLDKKIEEEISSKNNHYTWMAGVEGDTLNGSVTFSPKLTNDFFLISKLKLTKVKEEYKVEGVICNTSPCDISSIKIASAIMLGSDSDNIKFIRSSSKIYSETLKSGSANSFSVLVKKKYSPKLFETDFETTSSLNNGEKSNLTNQYIDLGLCIEEYVIHYKSFGGKEELVDKNYVTDTVYNYFPNISELFAEVKDFRNDDDNDNLNLLGVYEYNGIGKLESNYSNTKKKELLNALYQRSVNLAKNYQASLPRKFAEARNPALAFGDYEFDPKATNFERFKNSSCYNKLGFDPIKAMNDSVGLEKEYQVCEKEHRIKRNTKIFIYFFTAFVLFIITMVLFKKYYKKRIH